MVCKHCGRLMDGYMHFDRVYGRYIYCSSHPKFNPKKAKYSIHTVAESAKFKDYVKLIEK